MQRSLISFAAILSLLVAPVAFGATVFSDDFNRPDQPLIGSTPNVGGAWELVNSTVNPLNIVSNAVPLTNTGQDVLSDFAQAATSDAGNVIHTSLDITVSAAQATGDYFAHLGDGTTSAFYQRLFARSSGNGFQLGLVDTSGTGNTTTWGSTVLNFGQTYDVDVLWTVVAGSNNDTFAVTVDSVPYLTHAWTSVTTEPSLVSSAHLRQGSAGNAATLVVDNYSVDAAVTVPEPASISLLVLLGLAALVGRKR